MASLKKTLNMTCRVWNMSVFIVMLLTFSNVLLTLKLLQSSETEEGCSDNPPPPHTNAGKQSVQSDSLYKINMAIVHGEVNSEERKDNVSTVFMMEPQLGRWDARRLYKIHDFVVSGDRFVSLSHEYHVCLATQTSLDRMFWLIQVSEQWTGPISLAVFVPSVEYQLTKLYISYLRSCFPAIKEKVSFHFAYPKDHPPEGLKTADLLGDCSRADATLRKLLSLRKINVMKWREQLSYPQNHLRNIARKNCQTKYVFLTDIDIIPSKRLETELVSFLKRQKCEKCAWVIPTYELDRRVYFPQDKTALLKLVHQELARPFHQQVFIHNQYATNFTRWEQAPDDGHVYVSHDVKNFEFFYEPFYVSVDTTPSHDERFIGYGFTRNTQVYEMYVAGFQFHVLTPLFTCHWGLQKKKGRPSWRERQNNANRRLFETFKKEVFARYGRDPLKMMVGKKGT